MTAKTPERDRRIAQARAETVGKLAKAEGYSRDLQKPVQIEFYRAHIAYLDKLAAGEDAIAPKPQGDWDATRAVLDAQAEAPGSGG